MTRIRPISLAKLQGLVMMVVGLIAGILYAGIGLIVDIVNGALGLGTVLAFLAIIGMPVAFGTVGAIAGAVEAHLYNLISRWAGGIEIDLEP